MVHNCRPNLWPNGWSIFCQRIGGSSLNLPLWWGPQTGEGSPRRIICTWITWLCRISWKWVLLHRNDTASWYSRHYWLIIGSSIDEENAWKWYAGLWAQRPTSSTSKQLHGFHSTVTLNSSAGLILLTWNCQPNMELDNPPKAVWASPDMANTLDAPPNDQHWIYSWLEPMYPPSNVATSYDKHQSIGNVSRNLM